MKIKGYQFTDEHIAAGLAAMRGDFKARNVVSALWHAGVNDWDAAYRGADSLLQKERKAGRIYAVNNRNWKRVEL